MQKMVTFRLSREGRDIWLNPAKVVYVCHYETNVSSIHFGKECFVRVCGEPGEVVAKIEQALCASNFARPVDEFDDSRRPEVGHTEVGRSELKRPDVN
jgi:hypothetical protein